MVLKTQNNAVKTTLWQVTGKERPLPIYWPSTPPPQVITKFDKRQITFKSRKIVIYAYFSITFEGMMRLLTGLFEFFTISRTNLRCCSVAKVTDLNTKNIILIQWQQKKYITNLPSGTTSSGSSSDSVDVLFQIIG